MESLKKLYQTVIIDNSLETQTIAIILSAILAFAVIVSSKKTARKKATLEQINLYEDNPKYASYRKEFIKLVADQEADRTDSLVKYAGKDQRGSDAAAAIDFCLNQYELMAVGIKNGILDEAFYRVWYFSSLKRDYDAVTPYINEVRSATKVDTYFVEFEKLAIKWKPLKKATHERFVGKRIWWFFHDLLHERFL